MGGPREPGGAPGDTVTGVAAAFQNGSMRVTADENTNSLVVIASPEDYRIIRGVIDKLDIMRRQVFVEATVVEVGSEDALDLGVAYHGGVPGDDGGVSVAAGQFNASSLSLTTDALSGLAVGVFGDTIDLPTLDTSTGETTTLSIPMFGVALQALATNSGVEILSNPSLLIVDNEEAKITVGRNVPFPSSTSYTTGNQAIQSFQREDVGITLKVTPQINEANFVTLEISLEVAEVEDSGSSLSELASSGGPTTSKRETENTVVVQDNQTIVIGGLIGTTQTKATTKVPILGDIPLLGVLFRGNRDTSRKTNLLIFLTPHVINEPADLQEVYRVKWAQRETFLNRFYGKSRDEQEAQLREILRGTMNLIDEPSVYRTKDVPVDPSSTVGGGDPTAPAEPTP
jgi:general secretion pathway protein D